MERLPDRIALVTGGGHGIGRATCEALARAGATVAVTDVDVDACEAVAAAIAEQGGRSEAWHLDVGDSGQTRRVIDEVVEKFGGLDVLVNNAGIAGPNRPTDEITDDEWREVIAINIDGVFHCTRAAIPHMKRAGRGCIINMSSIYGIIGAPDLPPYHASKGAVRLMTKTDALLYAGHGIRVNSVHPGYVWTPLVEGLARDGGQEPDEFRKQLAARHPIGRVGEPEDIAHGVVYLASDEAAFVTGSELVIDGGYTAQ
ncbi:glucose 1-dehydrogenase [bacterium]|nr:glucose 1-dehydrogenase [bacterium]